MENNKDIYFAPVMVPTLCRSQHFIRMIESLKRNTWAKYTDVYVGIDFPPSEKYEQGWREICDYVDHGDFSAFAKFVVFKHETNLGSGKNSDFLYEYIKQRYSCWIYADDDVEFSPNFLEYEDKLLWKYRNDEDIICISGYSYPLSWKLKEGANCLKQNFCVSSWGFGFWTDRTERVNQYINSGGLLKDARKFIKNGNYKRMTDACFRDYFSATLSYGSQTHLFKTWSDVSLRAYVACKNRYCIFPAVSMVRNYGFDGSGEYCGAVQEHGNHALTYDYSSQTIDTSNSFDPIVDESLAYVKENRDMLSEFDSRTPEQMTVPRHYFRLIKIWGYTLAKYIHVVEYAFSRIFKSVSR